MGFSPCLYDREPSPVRLDEASLAKGIQPYGVGLNQAWNGQERSFPTSKANHGLNGKMVDRILAIVSLDHFSIFIDEDIDRNG